MKPVLPQIDLRDKCDYPDCDRKDIVFVYYAPKLYCTYHYPIALAEKRMRDEVRERLENDGHFIAKKLHKEQSTDII